MMANRERVSAEANGRGGVEVTFSVGGRKIGSADLPATYEGVRDRSGRAAAEQRAVTTTRDEQ
jgi:hypothetical protein